MEFLRKNHMINEFFLANKIFKAKALKAPEQDYLLKIRASEFEYQGLLLAVHGHAYGDLRQTGASAGWRRLFTRPSRLSQSGRAHNANYIILTAPREQLHFYLYII
jgi:hypothetical protein